MKEIENNLRSKRLLADSEPIKQQYLGNSKHEPRKKSTAPRAEQEDDSYYQLVDQEVGDVSEGQALHPLYERYRSLLNDELPAF